MQIQLNAKNAFKFLLALSFLYLGYLIFFGEDRYPSIDVELREVVSASVVAAQLASRAVVKIFNERNLNVRSKGETDVGKAELLTQADLVSNHLMLGLLRRFPLLKVITEEKSETLSDASVEKYREDNYVIWESLRAALEKIPSKKVNLDRLAIWVDPLDATQEYTEGLTEYVTVMACVTLDDKPHFGVIVRPFSQEAVLGMVGFGLLDANGEEIKLKSRETTAKKIVVSRSHAGKVEELVKKAFNQETYTVEPAGGSGYKTLRLINGTAEIYIHTTAIKGWDTCAGDAIIHAAGGSLIDLKGQPFSYGADEDMSQLAMRNEMSLKRLRLRENYVTVIKQVETLLDEFRFNLSKTKAVVGFSFANSSIVDMRDMEPTTRIQIDDAVTKPLFILSDESETTLAKDESGLRQRLAQSETKTENSANLEIIENKSSAPSFRPFGVLEPQTAKRARQNIKAVLPLLCDLANLQTEIRLIDTEITNLSVD
ncbi:inositol monophosphatase family domain-containing protein [Ditylenchus destructor]|nr:inositol monophosphatase family domain-containing protein [Ditylenchus destructor]